jgi:hypothetical protein
MEHYRRRCEHRAAICLHFHPAIGFYRTDPEYSVPLATTHVPV